MSDPLDVLRERISGALRNHPERARAIDAVFHLELKGDVSWTLDLTVDPPRLEVGRPPRSDCSIATTREVLEALLDDPDLGLQFVFEGKLTLAGNTALAGKFRELVTLGT